MLGGEIGVKQKRVYNGQDSGKLNYRDRRNQRFILEKSCYLDGSKALLAPDRDLFIKRYLKAVNTNAKRWGTIAGFKVINGAVPHILLDDVDLNLQQNDEIPAHNIGQGGLIPYVELEEGDGDNLDVEMDQQQPLEPQQNQHPQNNNIVIDRNFVHSRLEKHMSQCRRKAIEYFYVHIFGRPPEALWVGLDLVNNLSFRLQIPQGSRHNVVKTLRNIMSSYILNQIYDGKKKIRRNGLIVESSPQAEVVYNAVSAGLSVGLTTCIINTWRAAQVPPLPSLSYSAVQGFSQRSQVIFKSRRTTKKSGKDDPDSKWAKARLAQCLQFKEQFRLGKLPVDSPELINNPLPPLKIYNVAFWDEKHQKVKLGHASKTECRAAKNAAGAYTPITQGGILPPPMPNTNVKYPGEARGLFGACVVREIAPDGTYVLSGKKAVPFCYTNRKVIGVKKFNDAKYTELHRVLKLQHPWGQPGQGYPERFPNTWEQELLESKNIKKVCSIVELVNHVIDQSIVMYAGTEFADTFLIFHDGLSAWWEDEAQAHIAARGFKNRQLRCMGNTNINTRYHNKLTGDSPEMCRALDSHGFADLGNSIKLHCSLSSIYNLNDIRRFKMGTPEEVWSTMCRCWEMEPTSTRIVEDVSKFEAVLDIIIAAQGCVVQDINFRTGRRGEEWARAAGGGDCKNKPRPVQRKATLKDRHIHPDCRAAYVKLCTGEWQEDVNDDALMAQYLLQMQQGGDQNNVEEEEENDDDDDN